MVIRSPIAKLTGSRTWSLRDFVKPSPMYCPIGVMAMSAPTLNKPIPAISRSVAPAKMASSIRVSSTHGESDRRNTMAHTGRTDTRASLSFSRRDFHRSFRKELAAI